MRRWIPLILLLAFGIAVAIYSQAGPATYADFQNALIGGADCAKLIDIRNDMEPKDPARNSANENLRTVGCFSRTSVRR